jgi:UDP-2-acetamido-2,6-beta-L-arabino-hexul-4-ose reductase
MEPTREQMVDQLELKEDARGVLIEVFKMPADGQIFYSTSKPGVIRGNHYHTRKIERFCVLEGQATIRLRNRATNEVREFPVSGVQPQTVTMLINWTHNIQNTGTTEMKLLVWANEVFNPQDPDTFPELV